MKKIYSILMWYEATLNEKKSKRQENMHGDMPCSFILKIPKMIQNIDLDVYIQDTIFLNWFLIEVFPSQLHNVGYLGSIPGSERSPGEGNSNPLQNSCLENCMDGGTSQATVHGVTKSQIRLNDLAFKGKKT